MFRLLQWLRRPKNSLWVKPTLGCLLAVVVALVSAVGNRLLPPGLLPTIEAATLDDLLGVIASSMLAVSTFSLSIMVAAFATAASSATSRATELVMGDQSTQTAITSFLASFLYSIVAKTALGLGYYGETGRFLLFLATIGVLVFLVATLLIWVRTMSSLGLIGNTLEKIEGAAGQAMLAYRADPGLGATVLASAPPADLTVTAGEVGYLQAYDVAGLQGLAEEHHLHLHLCQRPGRFVLADTPVIELRHSSDPSAPRDARRDGDDTLQQALRDAVLIGASRSFRQDPRFGLIVLAEVAQRALSPALNDPGTAIAVMNSAVRVLTQPSAETPEPDEAPRCDRLSIVPLDEADFVDVLFDPIARDGAAVAEVQWRLQKLLAELARCCPSSQVARAARRQAARALRRAQEALPLAEEREELAALHRRLYGDAAGAANG